MFLSALLNLCVLTGLYLGDLLLPPLVHLRAQGEHLFLVLNLDLVTQSLMVVS